MILAMARRARTRERPPLPPRLGAVFVGVLIGAAWGTLLWLLRGLGDADHSAGALAFLVISLGMIGGGVAAIFGTFGAHRRGERLFPRLPYRRRRPED
jgi:hypothetical protein